MGLVCRRDPRACQLCPAPAVLAGTMSSNLLRYAECRSVGRLRSRRSIGPGADPDEENCQPFFGIIRGHNRRTRQIRSPTFRRIPRNKEHEVRMPVLAFVAQVLLL